MLKNYLFNINILFLNSLSLYSKRFFVFLLLPISIFLTFNIHSHDTYKSYHSVIWADAAGYYVYLPMWFIYGNKANTFPNKIDIRTGNGFSFDKVNNCIKTKYLCGVSVLEAPFFLIANSLARPLGFKPDGFSKIYYWAVMAAGVFYACFGLLFLFSFLNKIFTPLPSLITTLSFFIGTNLYYYAIDAQGMSHVYSFFLVSTFLYLIPSFYSKPIIKNKVCLAISFALIFFIRPTNAIILFFFLLYDVNSFKELKARFYFFMKRYQVFLWMLLAGIIIAIPQMLYWKNTFHHFITYSYTNESFIYWKNPQLLKVWFSTNNGLFLYAPLLFLSVFGIVKMIWREEKNAWLIACIFLIISYICASWWCWWFGCSFGARSFIDFYPLFAIPIAYTLEHSSKKGKIILFLIMAICIGINMSITYYYDGCFYGGVWDFGTYLNLIF